jgi:GPH family glycoside/pentoside/hexuronide:cation symporter
MVIGLYLFGWTTASILAAVLVYFANYYLEIPGQANYLVLAAQGSAILFIPLVVYIARRLDKRRAFIIGSLVWVVVLLGISVLGREQISIAYALAALCGFGIATAYVVPWSMIPDVVEYDQVRSGQRREGSYYAFIAFFQKLGTGAALWGMGQVLAVTGYLSPDGSEVLPVQPTEAVSAIRVFAGPVPAVLLLVAVLFAWRYSITRESHQETLRQLALQEAENDG